VILFKTVNRRVNYCKINVYPTLFGDFLIQRERGRLNGKKPMSVVKEYFDSNREALLRMLDLAVDTKDLGYCRVA